MDEFVCFISMKMNSNSLTATVYGTEPIRHKLKIDEMAITFAMVFTAVSCQVQVDYETYGIMDHNHK